MCVSAYKEPKEIFSICQEIFELHNPVPLEQLPEFISKLVERKRSLESDFSKVELAIKGLQQEYFELFNKVSVTRFDLERYRKVEQQLKKYDLTLQDLQEINTIIENVNSIGSDPRNIIRELIEIKNCRQERSILEEEITHLKHAAMLAQQELRDNELKLASCKELLGSIHGDKGIKHRC
jgi:chromosome segregation ATPase